MLLALTLDTATILKIMLLAIFIFAAAAFFYSLVVKTNAPAPVAPTLTSIDSDEPATPAPTESSRFAFRKAVPHLVFVAAIILFVLLRPALVSLFSAGAPIVAADGINASSEKVVADQISGGYVQAGSLISRIVISVLFYALFSFVPWAFQQVTHPAFAKWKKEKYKTEFEEMTVAEKFEYDKGMSQSVALRVIATAIFCLGG